MPNANPAISTEGRAPWWDDVESDPTHLAAAEWLARLQKVEVPRDVIAEWMEWMRDARHSEAFRRIEEVSSIVSRMAPPAVPSVHDLSMDRYDGSVAIHKWRLSRRRASLAIAASVALGAVIVGAHLTRALWDHTSGQRTAATDARLISTQVGENRSISLEDGSRVTLGGQTQLKVELSKNVRSASLIRGEAYFQVAKDPTRRFQVNVGKATATAIGTAFNVHHDPERTVVTVAEGRVLLESPAESTGSPPERRAVELSAGEEAAADNNGVSSASAARDLSTILAWQTGRLSFRGEALRYVIRDVNRYSPKQIVLADADIGEISITGTISKENIPGWIISLERAFQLHAVEQSDRITIHSSK